MSWACTLRIRHVRPMSCANFKSISLRTLLKLYLIVTLKAKFKLTFYLYFTATSNILASAQ